MKKKKKYELFIKFLSPNRNSIILDVGCGQGTFLEEMYPYKKNIIALDISKENISNLKKKFPYIKTICTDGSALPFKDKSIDIIFSNAVIEHVGNYEKQHLFASEIIRVAKKYFVTTPNKLFPYEPHYRLPFFQFVPKKIQKLITKHFNVGNYKKGEWEDINLLTLIQLKKLFPDSNIIKHRVTLFPETLIAIKK
ncbi:MAG: class I SAM-dependent methyltransferase [archaeon]